MHAIQSLQLVGRGVLLIVVGTIGCAPAAKPPAATTPPAPEPSTVVANAVPSGETWDVILMQGAPLGYAHTVTRAVEQEGQSLREVESTQRMTVQRFGDQAAPGATFK